jgi:hypothetical protein
VRLQAGAIERDSVHGEVGDPELGEVVRAWPLLAEPLKAAVLAILRTCGG